VNLQLSQNDAALLLGGFTSIIVPFVYSWTKSNALSDWVKLFAVTLTCLIGGFLTVYAGGQYVDSDSIIQNAGKVAIAAGAIYGGIFRGLQVEKILFPRATVIGAAQRSVAVQIGNLSKDTITAVNDPSCPTSIKVVAEQVNSSPNAPVVIPRG
jgi:hypothetical protein